MNSRKQAIQGKSILLQNLFKKSIWSPVTSCTLVHVCGYHILKSPSLVSNIPDTWSLNFTNRNHLPIQYAIHVTNDKSSKVIDGKSISEKIILGIAEEVRRMRMSIGKVPGLGVVMVGERRDSQTYVPTKRHTCEEAGIQFLITELPDDCMEVEVSDALSFLTRIHQFMNPCAASTSKGKVTY